jgi:4-amino-4-deoxy-L-arabinose transferase-like glycosyltransferase
MAPGYVSFLLPFMTIDNNIVRNVLIILIQTTITLFTILLLYKFTAQYFSQQAAVLASIAACILPDFIYSVVSFTPTVLYQCAIISLMISLYTAGTSQNKTKPFQIALFFCLLTYIRSEFILFVLMYFLLQTLSHKWKDAVLVLGLTVILLSPWTIRNSIVFDRFTPISTGFGLNFYRGHNSEDIGSWGNDDIKKKILELPRNRSFEVSLSNLYSTQAFEYIYKHPSQEISNMPSKLFHLWIFSTLQERSDNFLYQMASWFTFIFFLIGFLTTISWQKHKYLYTFYFFCTIIALVFFTLPRHQTMMKVATLPFFGSGMEYTWRMLMQVMLKSK